MTKRPASKKPTPMRRMRSLRPRRSIPTSGDRAPVRQVCVASVRTLTPGWPDHRHWLISLSIDKLLREAHKAITAPTPNTSTTKRKRNDGEEQDATPIASRAFKLKSRRGTSEGTIKGTSLAEKSQTEVRRDDWDVPMSSSTVAGHRKGRASKGANEAQTKFKLCPVPQPESTIMDSTSSAERRMRETQELGQAGTSSLSSEPSFLKHDSSARPPQSSQKKWSANGSQVTVHAADLPNSPSETMIVLNHTSSSSKRRSTTKSATPADREDSPMSKATSKRKKRKASTDADDDKKQAPDALTLSDELAVGLPKERYVPRPSRSRSQGTMLSKTDQIDLRQSVTPSAKSRRPKRRKTEGDDPSADANVDASQASSKVGALVELGFSASQSRNALKDADGSKDGAANILLNGPTTVDAPVKKLKRPKRGKVDEEKHTERDKFEEADENRAMQPTSQQQTSPGDADPIAPPTRRSKVVLEDEEDEDNTTTIAPVPAHESRPAIPAEPADDELAPSTNAASTRKRGRPRKAPTSATRKLPDEVPDEDPDELGPDHDPGVELTADTRQENKVDDAPVEESPLKQMEEDTEGEVVVKKGKGKTRGRPKKGAAAKAVAIQVAFKAERDMDVHPVAAPIAALADGETDPVAPTPLPAQEDSEDKENIAQLPAAAKDKQPASVSPTKRKVQAAGGEGRVPLRVGLSKRMRIPSLLRSAKKP